MPAVQRRPQRREKGEGRRFNAKVQRGKEAKRQRKIYRRVSEGVYTLLHLCVDFPWPARRSMAALSGRTGGLAGRPGIGLNMVVFAIHYELCLRNNR
jgi:hypothetical protein